MKIACAVCQAAFESDVPDVLFFSKSGSARYVCPHCAKIYEKATLSRDPEEIEDSLSSLYDHTDRLTDVATLEFLALSLGDAKKRLSDIRNGTYDFALDEEEVPVSEEIPEEYRPDDAIEKEAAEKAKRLTLFDRIIDILWILVGVGAVGYIAYTIIDMFFL